MDDAVRAGGQRVVGLLARAATRTWFRTIEVEGMERLPADGPVLVVASHLNGFVDPALLYAVSPRSLRFLAKSTLWKFKPLGMLMNVAGAIPIYRSKDGGTSQNESVFRELHRVLRDGGAVAIFPEGTTHDEPHLWPIRTGSARIALGARAAGTQGLRIVPVGLVYDDKATPRSRALVRVGQPIDLDATIDEWVRPDDPDADPASIGTEDDHAAVDRLTGGIATALSDATIAFEDTWSAAVLMAAANIYVRMPDDPPELPIDIGRVEPIARRLAHARPDARDAVIARLAEYQLGLEVMKQEDGVVLAGPKRNPRKTAKRAGVAAALAPFAAAGAVLNGPTAAGVLRASDRPMARVSRANFTLLLSIAAFPVTWLAWALFLRHRRWAHPWRIAFLGGPLCGHAAIVCWENIDKLRRSGVGYRMGVRQGERSLEPLKAQRTALVEQVRAALAASPEPAAGQAQADDPRNAA